MVNVPKTLHRGSECQESFGDHSQLLVAMKVDELRGSPMSVGNLEEIIDEK